MIKQPNDSLFDIGALDLGTSTPLDPEFVARQSKTTSLKSKSPQKRAAKRVQEPPADDNKSPEKCTQETSACSGGMKKTPENGPSSIPKRRRKNKSNQRKNSTGYRKSLNKKASTKRIDARVPKTIVMLAKEESGKGRRFRTRQEFYAQMISTGTSVFLKGKSGQEDRGGKNSNN